MKFLDALRSFVSVPVLPLAISGAVRDVKISSTPEEVGDIGLSCPAVSAGPPELTYYLFMSCPILKLASGGAVAYSTLQLMSCHFSEF